MCFCNCLFCFDDAPVEDDPRRGNINRWKYSMRDAPSAAPGYCLYGYFCGPCAQYQLRRKLLADSFYSEYKCCQGYFQFPSCNEQAAPELCLVCEVCCCYNFALSANRFYIMDQKSLLSDPVDNQIIRFNNCIQVCACICDCLAMCNEDFKDTAQCVDCIANQVFLCVSGCMTAQMFLELKEHERLGPDRLQEYERLAPDGDTYTGQQENIPIARLAHEQDVSYGSENDPSGRLRAVEKEELWSKASLSSGRARKQWITDFFRFIGQRNSRVEQKES